MLSLLLLHASGAEALKKSCPCRKGRRQHVHVAIMLHPFQKENHHDSPMFIMLYGRTRWQHFLVWIAPKSSCSSSARRSRQVWMEEHSTSLPSASYLLACNLILMLLRFWTLIACHLIHHGCFITLLTVLQTRAIPCCSSISLFGIT